MSETYVYYHLTKPAAVLRATGPDAFAFLQSQYSNDLNHPEIEQPVTYGLWLDHKGKIQADSFIIQKTREDFLLVSYDCPAAMLLSQLEARLIADEVTLTDETAKYGLLHIWPAELDADLSEMMEGLADPAVCESWIGRRPMLFGTWDVLAEPSVMEKVVGELQILGAVAAPAEDLQALRIVAGVPSIPGDAGPGDLPQETGLAVSAVAYDKGCYLGQEVMSRLHNMGHVNRGLWQVGWEGAAPASGSTIPLYAESEVAGELRSHVSKDGQAIGLAMLKLRALSVHQALSFSPNGSKVVHLVKNLVEG